MDMHTTIPVRSAQAITPSNTAALAQHAKYLVINCTTAGNVKVGFQDGTTLTFPVAVGLTILPWDVSLVFVTGTTAVATYAQLI